MSGGPPHHPHNRQNPAANSAWNHLQVPNFFPRQPLHAHMSTDPAAATLLHPVQVQPTWHVPTTEPLMKVPPTLQSTHHHLYSLEQMVAERQQQQQHVFPRDLSSPRNGSGSGGGGSGNIQQNGGDVPLTPPISLSVRDTNKINSLPAGALEINVKSTCHSPGLSSSSSSSTFNLQQCSPKITASGRAITPTTKQMTTPQMQQQQQQQQQQQRLAGKRGVDSILERLNPPGHSQQPLSQTHPHLDHATPAFERPAPSIVGPLSSSGGGSTLPPPLDKLQASINAVALGIGLTWHIGVTAGTGGSGSQHDDNSNSSSILLNVPTPTNAREDDVVSPYSNDDNSHDSNKSRRKRKPCKTMRVSKDIMPTPAPPYRSPAPDDFLLKQSTDVAAIRVPAESLPITTALPTAPVSSHQPLATITTATLPVPVVASVQSQQNTVDNNIPRSDIPLIKNKISERRKSISPPLRKTSRRKASSESETIANIAAMVQEMQPNQTQHEASNTLCEESKHSMQQSDVKASMKGNEKVAGTPFREVENKLEEMFAGLEDGTLSKASNQPLDAITNFSRMGFDNTKDLLKLESNELLASTPDADTSKPRRSTRSTSEIHLDIGNNLHATLALSSGRRKKKTIGKALKRSKSASRNNSTAKSNTKLAKKSIAAKPAGTSTASGLVSSLASKLSSDIKDVVANAYDSGSNASSSKSRGPFIQIKGPRDSPHSVCIVNSSNTDGDEHQGSSGLPGVFGNKAAGKAKFHDDSEYRQRVRVRGLHCSTLSHKYDAQTRDATWICAFCKRGPHAAPPTAADIEKYPPPGDLFGPYVITTACAEYQRRLDDPYDKQFKSKKVCRSLEAVASTSKATIVRGGRGSKRKLSESQTIPTIGVVIHKDDLSPVTCEQSIMLGITIMPDAETVPPPHRSTIGRTTGTTINNNNATITTCYEVWAHEDCIVWSAGVHLAGGGARIVGLEAAVWASSGITCATCGLRGANVCCMRRGCARAQHYGCARIAGWTLREHDYAAFCTEHTGLTSRGTPAILPLLNGETC